ncbi:MAG: flavodoxin-dependent (E)-4-hydroxy-3-methylbut-2-enyl-diphosphate synthase [Christensenellales bacterium]
MTKTVRVGKVTIGNGEISVQSMTNTKTKDVDATVAQIRRLQDAGCDIVRVSVPDKESALACKEIVAQTDIPVVADIHFDSRLAIMAADSGVAKIRINPGNIGDMDKVRYLARYLKERSIPIRIGVNGGSLDSKYQDMPLAQAMCESVMEHVNILQECDFDDIIISAKSSNVAAMIQAYRLIRSRCDYPLHIGVTEAGTYIKGLIKSSIGIGSLLCDGIGDTIRVSLTDDPVKEVEAGIEILKACGKYSKPYAEVIACPTCARTNINVQEIAAKLEMMCKNVRKNVKIAVMGCVVNGIGESKGCDFGVAGGVGKSALFADGKLIESIDNDMILPRLAAMIEEFEEKN